MDKHNEFFDRLAKLVFGPAARVAGAGASGAGPGHLSIIVDARVVGTGLTFERALQDAQRRGRNELCREGVL
jgi:hypothetical protein